jgi:histidinol-phosphatase
MSESPESLEGAVEQVARIAGDIALRYYRSSLVIESKADGSPVTIADRMAEQAAREWIEENHPDDGIVGEELGITRPDARRRWVLDPIDGTKTFVRGVPLWGTLAALCEGDEVLAGAAYFPALGEMLAAARGTGCWWNGTRCRVSSLATLREATVLTTDERFAGDIEHLAGWRNLSARAAVARSWGDCYGYLLVATGRAEVMVDGIVSPWDAAALMPIVEEAGGVFTDWNAHCIRRKCRGDESGCRRRIAGASRHWHHEGCACLICPGWTMRRTAVSSPS